MCAMPIYKISSPLNIPKVTSFPFSQRGSWREGKGLARVTPASMWGSWAGQPEFSQPSWSGMTTDRAAVALRRLVYVTILPRTRWRHKGEKLLSVSLILPGRLLDFKKGSLLRVQKQRKKRRDRHIQQIRG